MLCRARATNTQLGKEENSAYVRLTVRGGDPGGEIAPEIVVGPRDSNIFKDSLATELQCIVNARLVTHKLIINYYMIIIIIDVTS